MSSIEEQQKDSIVFEQAPCYRGFAAPICRFKREEGGRRGFCNRRRGKAFFFHRFLLRVVAFFTLSLLYTEREAVIGIVESFTQTLATHTPQRIINLFDDLSTLAATPFELSKYFGLFFYSVILALFLTYVHMRVVRKKRAHFRKWLLNTPGSSHGGHHRHHHGRRHVAEEQEQEAKMAFDKPLLNDEEKGLESSPLIAL